MKLDTETLLSLRPAPEADAAGIAASIENVTRFRSACEARLPIIRARKGDLLLSGNAREVRECDKELQELDLRREDASVILASLASRLEDAQRSEAIAALHVRAESFGFPSDFEVFKANFRERYPAAALEIAELMQEEARLEGKLRQLHTISEELEALGEPPLSVPGTMARFLTDGTFPITFANFGDKVRLLGVLGAPLFRLEPLKETETKIVDDTVFNEYTGKNQVVGKKEVKVDKIGYVNHEDKTFWYPKDRYGRVA